MKQIVNIEFDLENCDDFFEYDIHRNAHKMAHALERIRANCMYGFKGADTITAKCISAFIEKTIIDYRLDDLLMCEHMLEEHYKEQKLDGEVDEILEREKVTK